VKKYDRDRQTTDDIIIGLLRFACCVIKAREIQTHSEYVIITVPYGNNEHIIAPQYYLTLPELLNFKTCGTSNNNLALKA
jgi:hypothetical protein